MREHCRARDVARAICSRVDERRRRSSSCRARTKYRATVATRSRCDGSSLAASDASQLGGDDDASPKNCGRCDRRRRWRSCSFHRAHRRSSQQARCRSCVGRRRIGAERFDAAHRSHRIDARTRFITDLVGLAASFVSRRNAERIVLGNAASARDLDAQIASAPGVVRKFAAQSANLVSDLGSGAKLLLSR